MNEKDSALTLYDAGKELVRIGADGTLTYFSGYTPDEAARLFWEAVSSQAKHRNTCAGCKHWNDGSDGARADCQFVEENAPSIIDMPEDGSGFCHLWVKK